jgi:uncharacterized protein
LEHLIAKELGLADHKVKAVLALLNEGATIPFIARYRKEQSGNLDEVDIEKIASSQKKFIELENRKKSILDRLTELGITDALLLDKIKQCYDPKVLEDLYLPYKVKRKTKASIAKEQGLEPLAKIIMAQRSSSLLNEANRFAKNGLSVDDALQGARHIIAEWINESSAARNTLRRIYQYDAVLKAKVDPKKKEEAEKYRDYFDFEQSLKRMPSHRLLAIFRAEKEALLKVKIDIDKKDALTKLERIFIKTKGECADEINAALEDALKRLLMPSIENETRAEAKEKADTDAIGIFSNNLKQLLMDSPLGAKRILALDPGFRTGCKLVCLDEQSEFLYNSTIYPHPPVNKTEVAKKELLKCMEKYSIQAIAIGNGTAGRESMEFVKAMLPKNSDVECYLVNEAGASIYSASENGRDEFPDLDLTVRGAISIGRRLMDPLAELVKIDAKSIGVGQYQHDVAQDKLKQSLDNTVSFTVNQVGVNINTASKHLLQYVAGIGPKLAKNIVEYRAQNGAFTSRKQLLKVAGLGPKAYEQSAGFLLIKKAKNPLDSTAVHPESYAVVDNMAKKLNTRVQDLVGNIESLTNIKAEEFTTSQAGLLTIQDILQELKKPGLDPRGVAQETKFDDTIKDISDLQTGMELTGKVSNLTNFGAFVDLGIKENGLLHKSQIANRFINDPAEILSLNEEVKVRILSVDFDRKRIQLTMKE